MPNKPMMSESKKSEIIALRNQNLSVREITRIVGYSKSAVAKFIKKYAETGSLQRSSGSGRPFSTTSSENRLLKRLSLQDRFKTAEDIRKEFIEACGSQISVSTVKRRLREAGLHARRPAKKPLLTNKMRLKRLQWAKEHQNWTELDWRRVMFSDESKFNIFGSDGIQYVRRRTGERYSEECVRQTVKQGASRMVWGCFSYYGIGQLALIDGTVNANVYKKILQENFIPSMEQHFSYTSALIFQDDSAPCHRAKSVKEYLSEVGVSAMEWPGNSPDLNPIENLWHIIKVKVAEERPTSLKKLDEAIKKVWYEDIKPETLQNLVASMPTRIKEVIKKKGGPTKY